MPAEPTSWTMFGDRDFGEVSMGGRPEGNMVLRSVYLPENVDDRLRALAFLQNRSKGDLVRELVQEGLDRLEEAVRGEREEPTPAAG